MESPDRSLILALLKVLLHFQTDKYGRSEPCISIWAYPDIKNELSLTKSMSDDEFYTLACYMHANHLVELDVKNGIGSIEIRPEGMQFYFNNVRNI